MRTNRLVKLDAISGIGLIKTLGAIIGHTQLSKNHLAICRLNLHLRKDIQPYAIHEQRQIEQLLDKLQR